MQGQIRGRYNSHREARNQQQKARLLASDFPGFMTDPVLEKLIDIDANPDFVDPRNCLVFWARPPARIKKFVGDLQSRLLKLAPSLWLMPLDCLHMTVLEITHSRSEVEIESLVSDMKAWIPEITNITLKHHAQLTQPMLSYDAAAIALSFVPANTEDLISREGTEEQTYTYHHLRRDIYRLSKNTGVGIASRYTVPSSHVTIARYISQKDITKLGGSTIDSRRVAGLVEGLERINAELEANHSTRGWIVGEENGLDCRRGTLWYGGGQTEYLGKGFFTDAIEDVASD